MKTPGAVSAGVMLAITPAKGALANSCTRAQVQDLLLLVAMYCGIPSAIETNQMPPRFFGEDGA